MHRCVRYGMVLLQEVPNRPFEYLTFPCKSTTQSFGRLKDSERSGSVAHRVRFRHQTKHREGDWQNLLNIHSRLHSSRKSDSARPWNHH